MKKKDIWKFAIVESIKTRVIKQTFLSLKSHQKSIPIRDKSLSSFRNLSLLVLTQFFHKKQRNYFHDAFKKVKGHKMINNSSKMNTLVSSIATVLNDFKKRVFMTETIEKLKKISLNQKRLNLFFKNLNLYIEKSKKSNLEESFGFILNEGFRKMYLNDIKRRQEKMIEGKNYQLNKQEQYRLLRTEISALSKTL